MNTFLKEIYILTLSQNKVSGDQKIDKQFTSTSSNELTT